MRFSDLGRARELAQDTANLTGKEFFVFTDPEDAGMVVVSNTRPENVKGASVFKPRRKRASNAGGGLETGR